MKEGIWREGRKKERKKGIKEGMNGVDDETREARDIKGKVDTGEKELSNDSRRFPVSRSRCIPPLQAAPAVQLPVMRTSGAGCGL